MLFVCCKVLHRCCISVVQVLYKCCNSSIVIVHIRGYFHVQPGSPRRTSHDESTVGVDVCDWSYQKKQLIGANAGPEIKFSTWDFAGQVSVISLYRYPWDAQLTDST